MYGDTIGIVTRVSIVITSKINTLSIVHSLFCKLSPFTQNYVRISQVPHINSIYFNCPFQYISYWGQDIRKGIEIISGISHCETRTSCQHFPGLCLQNTLHFS